MKKKLTLFCVLISIFFGVQSGLAQTALMNEIYSRGIVTAPDWIEIYNPTAANIDLTGYKIYDSGGQAGTKPKKDLPAGTIIPPYGFFVMVTDDTTASGFGLSSGGEKVWLENASGTIIDTITFPAMATDQTYGRYPDGSAYMKLTKKLTRGYANAYIKINEAYSRGVVTDPDWVEIYNLSPDAVDLTGYKIYDSGGQAGTKPKKEIPAGTIIPANGFFVIVTDDTTASGFGLSSGGEKVWLDDSAGVLCDSMAFTAMTEVQSYGRYPDGTANMQILPVITRGTANSITGIFDNDGLINSFSLGQNYPNPFNPSTSISFTIPSTGFVSLKVYNVLGKEVATIINGMKNSGSYTVQFDAHGLSSGIYFYQLNAGNLTATKKFVVTK